MNLSYQEMVDILFNQKSSKVCILKRTYKAKKNALVSGNAGDKKNLHPGGGILIFFNQFNRIFEIKFLLKQLP